MISPPPGLTFFPVRVFHGDMANDIVIPALVQAVGALCLLRLDLVLARVLAMLGPEMPVPGAVVNVGLATEGTLEGGVVDPAVLLQMAGRGKGPETPGLGAGVLRR